MNENGIKRACIYPLHSRDSKITTPKGFVNIDNGQMGETHWTSFYMKQSKLF